MENIKFVMISEDRIEYLVSKAVLNALELAKQGQPAHQQTDGGDRGYFTKKEAAEYLQVCEATVSNYAKDGLLTKMKLGRLVRFDAQEVRDLARTYGAKE